MKIKPLIFSLMALATPLLSPADEGTMTRILAPGFKTLKVQLTDDFFSPPVLLLGDDRVTLSVSFDELGDEHRYMRYSIEHCNPAWQPSNLVPSEYASGFDEARLEDYAYSQNTFRHYVNYRLTIPDAQLSPLISGNYMLRIWDEDEPDEALIQARFAVAENIGSISGSYSHITDRGADGPYQQLSFTYNPGDFEIRDPFADLQVIVIQNSDPATAVTVKPLRTQGKTIIYEHRPELLFFAGNEFRRFETTRTDYTGLNIDRNRYEGDGYSTWLRTDIGRADSQYLYDRTQWGRFKIDEYNSTDPNLGADYLLTNFTLDFPRVMNGDVYVEGEFTGYLHNDSTRMTWDEETRTYILPMLLKQGSYNYRYALVGADGRPVSSPVEGDFIDTRNEYTIYVYYTPPGARYSRLLTVDTLIP